MMKKRHNHNFLLFIEKRANLVLVGRFETEDDAIKYTKFIENYTWIITEIKCRGVSLDKSI